MLDLVCIFRLLFKGRGEMGKKREEHERAAKKNTDGMKYVLIDFRDG